MSKRASTLGKNEKKKLPFSKVVFEEKNQRRGFLIQKQVDTGLTPMETEELQCLQNEVMEYVDAKWPLPFEYLEQLKASLQEKTDA